MIKKPLKKKSLSYYQKKADRTYQEIGRKTYTRCTVCGRPYEVLHHFIKKSQSTALRYDFSNGVALCNSCHCSIHQGKNDAVTAEIVLVMGKEWFDNLMYKKKQGLGLNYGVNWYIKKCEDLKKFL